MHGCGAGTSSTTRLPRGGRPPHRTRHRAPPHGASRATDTVDAVTGWAASAPGVLRLPSGRLVRGRGLRRPLSEGLVPDLGVYLLPASPSPVPWETRWVRWPDFRLPADRADAHEALYEAWRRAVTERVEVACSGGRGRTGTALACLAVLDGVPP